MQLTDNFQAAFQVGKTKPEMVETMTVACYVMGLELTALDVTDGVLQCRFQYQGQTYGLRSRFHPGCVDFGWALLAYEAEPYKIAMFINSVSNWQEVIDTIKLRIAV